MPTIAPSSDEAIPLPYMNPIDILHSVLAFRDL